MKFDELVSRYATPDVLKHLRSQQFQVSLDILGTRITQGLTKQNQGDNNENIHLF